MPNRVIKHLTVTLSGQSNPETFDLYDDTANAAINKMNNVVQVTFTGGIGTGKWVLDSGTGYYTQTKTGITGYNGASITASDKPEVFYNASSVTKANAEDYAEQCGYINSISTGAGSVTARAFDAPTMNIVVDLKGV